MSSQERPADTRIRVNYALAGTVNGLAIDVRGTGSIDEESRALDLDLDLDANPKREAFQCDPKLLVLGSLDGLILAAAPKGNEPYPNRRSWLFGSDQLPVHFATRVTVTDDMGREIGTAVVSSMLSSTGRDGPNNNRSLDLRVQVIEARFHLLPTERVVGLGNGTRASVMSASDGSPWIVMTSTTAFETNFGKRYRAVGTSSFEVGSEGSGGTATGTFEIECDPQPKKGLSFSVAVSSL